MAEASHVADDVDEQTLNVDIDIDPDFEPQKRPRSCTWPPPRPESGASKRGTTTTNDTDVIPEEEDDGNEEEDDDDEEENGAAPEKRNRGAEPGPGPLLPLLLPPPYGASSRPVEAVPGGGTPPAGGREEEVHPAAAHGGSASQQLRKSSARRNAWGNYSYADLITQAIEGSPESRLTLSQIYDWMNSIRHNLSLHSRFLKVQNEGTGKSSWWMVNPEGGKGGKAPRRRAVSMDNSKYMKGARGRATKKKASLQAAAATAQDGSAQEGSPGPAKWTGSPASRSGDELDACWTDFRSRTNSNASTLSGRLSPILANLELDEGPDGEDEDSSALSPMLYSSPSSASPPAGLSDLACTMNLNDGLDPMDDLLDNISLTATQRPPPGEEDDDGGNSDGVPGGGSAFPFGAATLFSPPSVAIGLRQPPMQTIQENKQTTFSGGGVPLLFGDPALQDLLGLDAHGHADVMLTRLDPLMSQASTAVALQNARRDALLLRKDPSVQSASGASLPATGRLGVGDTGPKHRLQKSPVKAAAAASLRPVPPDRFPGGAADLDLDVFNGDLECDMDAIIRNELMDADCLDLSFESHLATGPGPGSLSGTELTSPHSWVPS
ncbi:hypothetical protein NHX12_019085 [Muraenolepis orangiensis]|uniref:Fork-head domain-containing protein n=1 Tax=Muraenolepis orangiensis TaxID=630683 RepID=A0A9Q0EY65_9TELE|nr:hypothetical protein NHX12_019085 [Muraenolepis orangiensis]